MGLIDQLKNDSNTNLHLDLFIVTRKTEFSGKDHWMDERVVMEVINHEDNALDSIQDPPSTITDFFVLA